MPLLRQTIWGGDCILLLPRVASPGVAYINWQVPIAEEEMTSAMKRTSQIVLGAAIFAAGIAAGSVHARSAAVQNRFGQPKTVLHVVVYKFRDNVSNYDRERAISGIKDMAGKIPGIKNVWLKTARNQIKDFSGVYAIEFTNAEAAADYAEARFMRRGQRCGRSSARTVFPSRFRIRRGTVNRAEVYCRCELAHSSRVIPYLLRIIASMALSGRRRFAHLSVVASGVTP